MTFCLSFGAVALFRIREIHLSTKPDVLTPLSSREAYQTLILNAPEDSFGRGPT